MRHSFRLLVAAAVQVWPVPPVPPVLDAIAHSFGEAAAAVSPARDPHREVAGLCPVPAVPAVPAVPSTRTTARLSGTYVNGRGHPVSGGAARWA